VKTADKIRLAGALYRLIKNVRRPFGWEDQVQVVRNGFCWDLDLAEGIDLAIFAFGSYERKTGRVLQRLVGAGSAVLDIGANIGAHTLRLGRLVGPTGKVYAFEPTDYAFRKLERNLELNPEIASSVVAEQIRLIGNRQRESSDEIYSSWKVVGADVRHPKHFGIAQSTSGARAMTLDRYCQQQGIARVDFVKLDVDGFECEVIAGGMKVLERDRPKICMELAPYVLAERGSSLDELLSLLDQCEYKLTDLSNGRTLTRDPVELNAKIPDGAGNNVMAVPG
jgi:FkbM family methyltransferase